MKLSNIIILSLLAVLSLSVFRCSHNSSKAQELQSMNTYLNDTVSMYSDKLGRVSAQRTMLIADAKDLEKINDQLYEESRVEKKTKFVTRTKVSYKTDTLYKDNNFTVISDSVLSDVNFDLGTIIVGYDKNNRLFAKSTNEHVLIDSLDGVLLSKKPRKIGIGLFFGPSISYGVISNRLDFGASIGIGVTFRIK